MRSLSYSGVSSLPRPRMGTQFNRLEYWLTRTVPFTAALELGRPAFTWFVPTATSATAHCLPMVLGCALTLNCCLSDDASSPVSADRPLSNPAAY